MSADLQVAVHNLELIHQIAAEILRRGNTPHEEVALAQLARALEEARADQRGGLDSSLPQLIQTSEAITHAWQKRTTYLRNKLHQILAGEGEGEG